MLVLRQALALGEEGIGPRWEDEDEERRMAVVTEACVRRVFARLTPSEQCRAFDHGLVSRDLHPLEECQGCQIEEKLIAEMTVRRNLT